MANTSCNSDFEHTHIKTTNFDMICKKLYGEFAV